MRVRLELLVLGLILLVASRPAWARDSQSFPFPGVRYLERHDGGQVFHVVIVPLNSPYFSVRATKPDEKGRTTSDFAKHVGAAVAVSGDGFTGGFTPRNLAVGDGARWSGVRLDKDRALIACKADKACTVLSGQAAAKIAADTRKQWNNVVGGGALLIRDGKVRSADEDASCGPPCTGHRPRVAVGLGKYRANLYLLVAEGGRPDAAGPTLRQVAQVLRGLGAFNAMSLQDGNGAAMVVAGKRVNKLPARVHHEQKVANHLAVVYTPPKDGCTLEKRNACAHYGCTCVEGQCNGGFCPGTGCTEAQRKACARYGCLCVDMQCSGGFCPGTGCTAKMTKDCKSRGCSCVDGNCAGGKCPGVGCTARQTKDCAKNGCKCAGGECSGGFCPGTGCEPKLVKECAGYGCACVDGKCSGGHCPGTGCTAKMTKDCRAKGCGCVDGKCSGGKCAGSGCTIKQVNDCSGKSCGCSRGKCTGGRCVGGGCSSCSCDVGRRPGGQGGLVALLLLALLWRRGR